MSFAENELLNKSGVKSIFRTTFNNLSCNYIGGCLDLYEITRNGAVKIFDNEKINEHGIQYVHDVFNGLSVSLNAEVLVSKLVMSENLWLENNSGNYKFDDNGFTATSGKNTIKIQPNNSGELFSIYNGSNKQVYINSSGDVEFAGTLKSASGQFSGLLSGGSINLGNGVFTVDKNGNMYASSARISGEVNASYGTIGGWNINYNSLSSSNNSVFLSNDGTISGATITGANGEFTEGFSVNLKNNDITKMMKFDGNSFEVNIQSAMMRTRDNSIVIDPYENRENNITLKANNGFGHVNIIADEIRVNDFGSGYSVVVTTDLLKTSEISATYISSNYSSIGDNIIKFSNSTSKKAYAASCDYVQQYTSEMISGLSSKYAPKEHSHPKYTTESEVRSIVRSMVKSKYLN